MTLKVAQWELGPDALVIKADMSQATEFVTAMDEFKQSVGRIAARKGRLESSAGTGREETWRRIH